jgi:hypothetical protein
MLSERAAPRPPLSGHPMAKRICENCQHKDEDWTERNGHIVKTPYCAARRPEFPVAFHCHRYEPMEPGHAE